MILKGDSVDLTLSNKIWSMQIINTDSDLMKEKMCQKA